MSSDTTRVCAGFSAAAAGPVQWEPRAEQSPSASAVVSTCMASQLYFSDAFECILFAQVSLKIKFSTRSLLFGAHASPIPRKKLGSIVRALERFAELAARNINIF